jgi:hypothetical protein
MTATDNGGIKMKKIYETPEMKIRDLENMDVIVTSMTLDEDETPIL